MEKSSRVIVGCQLRRCWCWRLLRNCGQSSDEGKTSVNPDSWTECGVGQSGHPLLQNMEHGYMSLREGGRGQRESSALCLLLRHNNAILIQERVEGALGWDGEGNYR